MSEPTSPTQAGQTVHGPQTNIAGGVTQYGGLFNTGIFQGNIVIPPPQPTLATPPAPPPDFVGRTEQLAQLAATFLSQESNPVILSERVRALLAMRFRTLGCAVRSGRTGYIAS
ncbi:MAG: hypothetical protein R3E79_24045 [Caldilineaceae bacterium]